LSGAGLVRRVCVFGGLLGVRLVKLCPGDLFFSFLVLVIGLFLDPPSFLNLMIHSSPACWRKKFGD
jgi:hypothetical protein